MNFLRLYFGKAKNRPANRHESEDKNENNKLSGDLDSDSESTQDENIREPFNEYTVKMINFLREFAIFCFIFMVYAAITNDPPKVVKAPTAYPFFSKSSMVKDYYRGQIITAIEHARSTDFAFIMFYAPWDAESQAARQEFEEAANFLKDNVVFSAVNCWQPGSECRNQYNKVYRWPVLIAYPTYGSGIQYNGPLNAPHMISFLQKIMKPLKRVEKQILDFNEAYVIAELNPLPKNPEYLVYYQTALKYLEVDPLSKVSFYVKPVKKSENKLSLHLWDGVLIQEIQKSDWKIDTILNWVLRNTQSSIIRVMPSGSKSLLLSTYLQPGPSLILFTPLNPLHKWNDYHLMLQEISQEYRNCSNYWRNFDIKSKRIANLIEHETLLKSCFQKQHYFPKSKIFPSITTNVRFLNDTTVSKLPKEKIELDCHNMGVESEIYQVCQNIKVGECLGMLPHLPKSFTDGHLEKNMEENELPDILRYKTSMIRSEHDPKSMLNLMKTIRKEKCKTFRAAQKLFPAVFEPLNEQNMENTGVYGWGCSNQSLNFLVMDSLIHYPFAERLGIDLSKKLDRSSVVIINDKMEVHYIMEEPITSVNIEKFIRNFTNNTLLRSVMSTADVESKNTPRYTFKTDADFPNPTIHLRELNSHNFLGSVLEKNKAVIVMYYSKQCSYCNGISYVLLILARKLRFVNNIEFFRIDGDIHILPWMYTMEQFPTILFFPARRKEETRVFPQDLSITVPNLMGFVLTNVDPAMRLHIMYSVCLQNQLEKDKNECLSSVRSETLSLIEQTLKEWRKSNSRQRRLLLHNLGQLRHLQFLFNHTPEDHKLVEKYFKKLIIKQSKDYVKNSTKVPKDEL